MKHLNRLLAVASATFFIAGSALAQNGGTVTNHAYAIGKGAGTTGYSSLLCTSAQLAVGQAAADPICKTLTGDVTISAAGVTAIGANKITNGMMRQSVALSLVGNAVNATANVADISAVAASDCVFRESASTVGCGTIATNGIANNAVTNAKIRQSAGLSVVGNSTASTANVADITGTADQVLRVAPLGASVGFGSIDLSKSAAVGTSLLGLANGGCNAALTASNGGILWSNATQCQILAGTATARLPLLSGASATPVWGAYTLPASVTSGGIPYFSSTTAESSSGLLTANAIMLGGGAGAAPATLGSLGTTTTVLHGNAAGGPSFASVTGSDMAANTVANSNLATAADSTIKSNISGGVAAPSDNTITAVLDKQFGTTQGSVIYRSATQWVALAPGTAGQFLTTQGAAANPNWSSGGAGTGTVTSVICGTGLSGGTITASGTCAVNLPVFSAVLGADVALNNTSTFFDGPSVPQGTVGTWRVTAKATLTDTSIAAGIDCKLWDGTTVIDSGRGSVPAANFHTTVSLSGYLANPAANIKISCKDASGVNGIMRTNITGGGKDTTIYAERIQ